MNVLLEVTIVTPMPNARTTKEVSLVHVGPDTQGMGRLVQVNDGSSHQTFSI